MAPDISSERGSLTGKIDIGVMVAAIVLLSIFTVFMASLVTEQPFSLLRRFPLGLDFQDFYRAAGRYATGTPVYQDARYVTPPTAAILLRPFLAFEPPIATLIFLACNFLMVSAALALLVQTSRCSWLLLVGALLSYPVLFLLDRGNVDGLVFLLLTLVVHFWRGNSWLLGAALMAATLIKVYPIVLFIPALVERRWKLIGTAILVALCFVILNPSDWWQFATERIFGRSIFFDSKENVSLTNGVLHVQRIIVGLVGGEWDTPLRAGSSAALAKPLWAAGLLVFSLTYGVVRRARWLSLEQERALLGILFVFPMFLHPAQVYQYSQILVLLVLVTIHRGELSACLRGFPRSLLISLFGISLIHNEALVASTGAILLHGTTALANLLAFLIVMWFCLYSVTIGLLRKGDTST